MGTVVSLNTADFGTGKDLDSLVVRENYTATDGGVTLDMTGYARDYIRAGHIIIKETATGVYKPMPITGDGAASEYDSLPGGHEYYGHAVQSARVLPASAGLPTSRGANVGVTYHAKINPLVVDAEAGYFDMSSLLTALRAALTHVIYRGDND